MTSQVQRQENLLSDCVESLQTWKGFIENYCSNGEETANAMKCVEEIVKGYCLIDFEATNAAEICEKVSNYFDDDANDHNVNVEQIYQNYTENIQSSSCNYQQHKIWKKVFTGDLDLDVEEVQQQKGKKNEEMHYEEMQDQIFCSNVFTPPVDPISKKIISNPFKSKSCGHIYEHKFILQYIKSMKNKAKCPYIGCGNINLTVSELVQDQETQEKIENYKRTQSEADEDSEDSDE